MLKWHSSDRVAPKGLKMAPSGYSPGTGILLQPLKTPGGPPVQSIAPPSGIRTLEPRVRWRGPPAIHYDIPDIPDIRHTTTKPQFPDVCTTMYHQFSYGKFYDAKFPISVGDFCGGIFHVWRYHLVVYYDLLCLLPFRALQ